MAAASSRKFSFMSIGLFSLLLLIHAPRSSSLSFSFNFSNSGDPCDAELRCEHDSRRNHRPNAYESGLAVLSQVSYWKVSRCIREWFSCLFPRNNFMCWLAVTHSTLKLRKMFEIFWFFETFKKDHQWPTSCWSWGWGTVLLYSKI